MELNLESVKKILVVRLRSIGDSVLATPTLIALRHHFPNAQIDYLLEDWVAPLFESFADIDNVISVKPFLSDRIRIARTIGKTKYDLAINLHGGTTAGFFIGASRAKYRIGYEECRYPFLYTNLLESSATFWDRSPTHSAEQQMALAGFIGIPVGSEIKTRIDLGELESAKIGNLIENAIDARPFALIHPFAAFATKSWSIKKFAMVAKWLSENGIRAIAVGAPNEKSKLEELRILSKNEIEVHADLSLVEIAVLASRARIFIGNDSGIAHIAAAVNTPSVVIFGSSNRDHWYPWTNARYEIVYNELPCQPCPGYKCNEFGKPICILDVSPEAVIDATALTLE